MRINSQTLAILPLIIGFFLVKNINSMDHIKPTLSTWVPEAHHPYAKPVETVKGNGYRWKIKETYRIWGIGIYTEKVRYQQVQGKYNYPFPPEELERSDFTLCKKVKALLAASYS